MTDSDRFAFGSDRAPIPPADSGSHDGCGPRCSYRSLYEGAQASLADLAAKQAAALSRYGALRRLLIDAMRQSSPRRFLEIQRRLNGRVESCDDTTLTAYGAWLMKTAEPHGLDDLRRVLSEVGFAVDGDDLSHWAHQITQQHESQRTSRLLTEAVVDGAATVHDVFDGLFDTDPAPVDRSGDVPRGGGQTNLAGGAATEMSPVVTVAEVFDDVMFGNVDNRPPDADDTRQRHPDTATLDDDENDGPDAGRDGGRDVDDGEGADEDDIDVDGIAADIDAGWMSGTDPTVTDTDELADHHRLDDDGVSSDEDFAFPALDDRPSETATPADDQPVKPVTDRNDQSATMSQEAAPESTGSEPSAAADSSEPAGERRRLPGQRVVPELFPSSSAKTQRRTPRVKAQRPRLDIEPESRLDIDGADTSAIDDAVDGHRPIFVHDLEQRFGADMVARWRDVKRRSGELTFVSGRSRHRERGSLVIPKPERLSGWWKDVSTTFRSRDLYELAVLLSRIGDDVTHHRIRDDGLAVIVHVKNARGLLALIVVTGHDLDGPVGDVVIDELHTLRNAHLDLVAVLATSDPDFEPLCQRVLREDGRLSLGCHVVGARSWEWVDGAVSAVRHLLG